MYAYIRTIIPGPMPFVEIITIGPVDGVPPRPTPGPTPPDPNAPHPSHPIMLPGMPGWGSDPWLPHPSHPIAVPGDPWWGTITPKPPQPPTLPPSIAVVYPLPPSAMPDPPPTPPANTPDATLHLIWFGPNTLPTFAWVPPYVDASPPATTPPAEPKPA